MTFFTDISNFAFSSAITDIVVDNAGPVVSAEIRINGDVAFVTSLEAYDERVTINRVDEILREYMEAQGLNYCQAEFFFDDGECSLVAGSMIFYSSMRLRVDAYDWTSTRYLTTRRGHLISRDAVEHLCAYVHVDESVRLKYAVAVKLSDGSMARREVYAHDIIVPGQINDINVSVEAVESLLNSAGIDFAKLLAFSAILGERVMAFYVSDEVPQLRVAFRNLFNCVEVADIFCATTTKGEVSQSETMVNGVAMQYDRTVEESFVVESAPMTAHEAEWIKQMIYSHDVMINGERALITDSDYAVSDDDSELPYIKFTWKYADSRPSLFDESVPSEIFTDPFDYTFT